MNWQYEQRKLRHQTHQKEILTWQWFSNLLKCRREEADMEEQIQACSGEPLYQKNAEKNKKINKSESGIKSTGIFLFHL